jgi:phosphatidylglycerol lysyltransferase
MLRRIVRSNPVTIVLVLALLSVAAASRGVTGPTLPFRLAFGTGFEQVVENGRWWTPLSSMFLTDGSIELVIVVLAATVLVGISERVMGSTRTASAFLATAVFGVMLGVTLQAIGGYTGELWSHRVSELVTLDPMTAVAGTLMSASAFVGVLWRRRIRVLTLSTALVFLLYSGQPSDLYRICGALAGLAFGYVLRPSENSLHWHRSSHHEARVLLSAIVAITALGPAVTLLTKTRFGALAPLGLLLTDARPTGLLSQDQCQVMQVTSDCLRDITLERISGVGPVLLTLLPLLALLVAAFGLARGRRFAAWLAIVVNVALGALAALFYGVLPLFGQTIPVRFASPRYWEVSLDLAVCTLLPLAIAILLLFNLKHFTVYGATRAVETYLAGVFATLIALSAVYVGVGWVVRDSFRPHVSFIELLSDLPDRFAPVGFLKIEPLAFRPAGGLSDILYYWIGPTFWLLVVLGALLVTIRPASRSFEAARAQIRQLLRDSGGGSLAYWATWEGNRYWFSPDGNAAVAYRLINGIAITTSDPIGEEAACLAAVAEFARYCDDNGWTPVFYAIHASFVEACTRMGWSSTFIGDETLVHPRDWETTGKRWQDVRSSINRAERGGVRAEWTTFARLNPSHLNQLAEISEQWVAEKDLPEMGFTLGGLDELRDPGVQLMIAFDATDRVVGVTSWLPSFRKGRLIGWTLDFMRRKPDGPNGVMEFLIARSAERFRDDGIEFMSLSTAPLARGNDPQAPAVNTVGRILQYIGTRLEPVYGFRSLFSFKRKFQPQFVPLSMAYPDPLVLPAIGIALARAYLPSLSLRQSIRFLRNISQQS